MEDINLLLSFIETEVLDGKKTFMGNGVVVNGENILNLIKRIRISLNAMDGTDLIGEANERAQKIIALAEQRKEQILDESIVMSEAKAFADRTISDALARRNQIEETMKRNIVTMLNQVKKSLVGAENGVDEAIAKITEESQ